MFVDNLRRNDIVRELQLPCGQCVECRLERSRQWAMRCMHEASLHRHNCFVTLTYDDEHLPDRGQLVYSDFQLFMKRFRKSVGNVRFYACGEYGETTWRPHFHACLFGQDLPDKTYWRTTEQDFPLYRSELLEKVWPLGQSEIGSVTFETAAYCARYCMKKVTGDAAEDHYRRYDFLGEYQLNPEFCHMSLKPGIGAGFMDKYGSDSYNHDFVIVNGVKCRPPKYYDRLFSRSLPKDSTRFEDVQFNRYVRGLDRVEDNSPERLLARETVSLAKVQFLKRSLM